VNNLPGNLLLSDFDYILPPELIAQTPLAERTASRLMLVDREQGFVAESSFAHLGRWLRPGDLLVANNTKVLPARLQGKKITGGSIELLLLNQIDATTWSTLVRPGRRLPPGREVVFGDGILRGVLGERLPDGERKVEFTWDNRKTFLTLLAQLGEMPLPPYIHESLEDQERYQTVYSAVPGSSAAPTAGLHFTADFMAELQQQGVAFTWVTLQIGLGTFRPVQVERVADHVMHRESYNLNPEAAGVINATKASGGRIIAVGTTSCRVLEAVADTAGKVVPQAGSTDLFITPGYNFKVIDGLITNFHLPKSTLLMLVSALAGRENILQAYAQAVASRYRFFSFGDAMFIGRH